MEWIVDMKRKVNEEINDQLLSTLDAEEVKLAIQ